MVGELFQLIKYWRLLDDGLLNGEFDFLPLQFFRPLRSSGQIAPKHYTPRASNSVKHKTMSAPSCTNQGAVTTLRAALNLLSSHQDVELELKGDHWIEKDSSR